MMFLEMEDECGIIETIAFPNIFAKFEDILKVGKVLVINGKISKKDGEIAKILISNINEIKREMKLYIRLPKDKFELENNVIDAITNLGGEFRGNVPIYIYYEGMNKLKILSRNLWLNSNNYTINKLYNMFGSENVKLK